MSAHRHYGDQPCVELTDRICLIEHSETDPLGADVRFTFSHEEPTVTDGFRCEGSVRVPPWTMTGSLAGGDLTFSPSILCRNHGEHGFVQNGAWVPA